MSTHVRPNDWTPSTEDERSAVWRQLDRLLSDPSFNRSKRYPSLLRFLVSRSLDGHSESLKERLIGIEAFGREPDYDSVRDPIVRVTAAENRKRILHYYNDPLHNDELRLLLRPGSYIPEFIPPVGWSEKAQTSAVDVADPSFEVAIANRTDPPQAADASSLTHDRGSRRLGPRWLGIAALTVALGLALFFALRADRHATNAFWAPGLSFFGTHLDLL